MILVERVIPINEHNVPKLIALITFWSMGALYPLIFWPHSYGIIKSHEHKTFPTDQKFKFDRHMFSNEVYAYIDKFAHFYRHKLKVFTLKPQTFENRSIKVVRLSLPELDISHRKKGTILALAGIIGCNWNSVSAAIDLIHKLCEECPYKVPYSLEFDWYIIPIFNPDGYDYTLTEKDPGSPLSQGQKNRQVYPKKPNATHHCIGVYLDRNFGFHWGESKAVDYQDPCASYYAGPYPFSERETVAMRKFIDNFYKKRKSFTIFLQIHGKKDEIRDEILYPWRFTQVEPFNKRVLDSMAKRAANEVNNLTGSEFSYFQSGKRSFSSGVIADWLMGVYRVTYVFIIEPYIYVQNSTDEPDQQLYIQKTTTTIFSLLRQYNHLYSSAITAYSDISHVLLLCWLLISTYYLLLRSSIML